MTSKEEIEAVINKFFHSMDTQNLELMNSVIAKSDDMVHIGTAEDEIWRGWDDLEKATVEQFKNLEYYKADIYNLGINIASSGDIAWYSHLLDARIKSKTAKYTWKGARFTGILEKKDDNWFIIQTHVSIPEQA